MSSNTPVYVAGFDLGVLPIGFWEMWTILSMYSNPFICLYAPGFSFELYTWLYKILVSIWLIRVLFPLPDTPVTQVNVPSGNLTLIFFKLFSLAPFSSKNFPVPFLLFLGTSIHSLPLKYLPVRLFSSFATSSGVPIDTICPPLSPAKGPTSTRKSHFFMVSVSCSTTISVLPKSRILSMVSINLSLSLWWSPILGSSNTYKTPVNLVPTWVASLILWASPPDKVPAFLLNVR